MSTAKREVYNALVALQLNGPKDNTLGICNYLDTQLPEYVNGEYLDHETVMDELIASWPNKSCSEAYPVGNWTTTPSMLFWSYFDSGKSMWGDDRYGKARKDLLQHCINELSNQLREVE